MSQDPNSKRGDARRDYEIAFYTKELGRKVQRQLLNERIAALGEREPWAAAHGEDVLPDAAHPPPPDDRAG